MKRLLFAVLVAACSRTPRGPAWPAMVADRQAQADRLIDGGDREGAARVLATILASGDRRSGDAATVRALLQDTRFRLARLALDQHQAAVAVEHTDRGLALGGDGDLFIANLLVARGAAREMLGEAAAAVNDYDRAMRINEALLREAVAPR